MKGRHPSPRVMLGAGRHQRICFADASKRSAPDDLTKYLLATRDRVTEAFLLHRLILDVIRREPRAVDRRGQLLPGASGRRDPPNNLATLLQDTNRLGEAEPPSRLQVAIFLAFQRDTCCGIRERQLPPPARRHGQGRGDIDVTLMALVREVGLDLR